MTSNIGARNISEGKLIGFNSSDGRIIKKYEEIKNNVMAELKKAFRPEFLNRVDEIIVFKQLQEEEIEKIASLMLKKVSQQLSSRNMKMKITKEMLKHIAKTGFDPIYGARPLKRIIQSDLEDKLAEEILEGSIQEGDDIKVDFK